MNNSTDLLTHWPTNQPANSLQGDAAEREAAASNEWKVERHLDKVRRNFSESFQLVSFL